MYVFACSTFLVLYFSQNCCQLQSHDTMPPKVYLNGYACSIIVRGVQ